MSCRIFLEGGREGRGSSTRWPPPGGSLDNSGRVSTTQPGDDDDDAPAAAAAAAAARAPRPRLRVKGAAHHSPVYLSKRYRFSWTSTIEAPALGLLRRLGEQRAKLESHDRRVAVLSTARETAVETRRSVELGRELRAAPTDPSLDETDLRLAFAVRCTIIADWNSATAPSTELFPSSALVRQKGAGRTSSELLARVRARLRAS